MHRARTGRFRTSTTERQSSRQLYHRCVLTRATALILLLASTPALADTHYVSHSGSNAYPYDSWATAADTVARAVEAAAEWDTILIAAGHFVTDTIRMKRGQVLQGAGMDSTVLDGLPLAPTLTIVTNDSCTVMDFTMLGVIGPPGSASGPGAASAQARSGSLGVYVPRDAALAVRGVRFQRLLAGVSALFSNAGGTNRVCVIDSCEFLRGETAIEGFLARFSVRNCLLAWDQIAAGAVIDMDVCALSISNCRFYGYDPLTTESYTPAVRTWACDTIVIRNNLFYSELFGTALRLNWDGYTDSMSAGIIENNTFVGFYTHAHVGRPGFLFRNNVSTLDKAGELFVVEEPIASYNLTWNNSPWDGGVIRPGDTIPNDLPGNSNNRNLDPMFVDTIDYLLQAYSPAIDAGDPTIFDADGSRSDIGYTGGPGGFTYAYQDLPPQTPEYLWIWSNEIWVELNWPKSQESDFDHYELYRSGASFDSADPSLLLATIPVDTHFVDTGQMIPLYVWYRLRAVDAQGNASDLTAEAFTVMGDAGDDPLIPNLFDLRPNYPNPFNAQTRIEYTLAEPSYVTLTVYDALGRKVETIAEGARGAGRHLLMWDARDRGSGVYFLVLDTPTDRRVRKALLLK